MTHHDDDQHALREEIADLERRLQHAKTQLKGAAPADPPPAPSTGAPSDAALHTLLLLADSALPLGSFAFSSGLESYLAHRRLATTTSSASQQSGGLSAFHHFLRLSLCTLASTALPYVLAAHRAPCRVRALDNDLDASTPCTVARRASIAQGRALLSVWERSFRGSHGSSSPTASTAAAADDDDGAVEALAAFQAAMRGSSSSSSGNADAATDAATMTGNIPGLSAAPNAHLAPLWGLVTRVLGLSARDAAYVFLLSHARAVTSAAVRASVFGPYQAQAVLAAPELRERVGALVDAHWDTAVEDAGQCVPVVDLWVGRHEKLYSRIFNS